MRIHFATIERAKKLARTLRRALTPTVTVVDQDNDDPQTLAPKTMERILAGLSRFAGAPTTRPITLSHAQTILAEISGYSNWHELASVTATEPTVKQLSADDARHFLTRAIGTLKREAGCGDSNALEALMKVPITGWEARFFLIAPLPPITTEPRMSVPSWNPSDPPTIPAAEPPRLQPWYGTSTWPILSGTEIRVQIDQRDGKPPRLRPVDGRHRIVSMTSSCRTIPVTCLLLIDAPSVQHGRQTLIDTFGREIPIEAFDLSPSR